MTENRQILMIDILHPMLEYSHIQGRDHCHRRAAKFGPMLGAYSL